MGIADMYLAGMNPKDFAAVRFQNHINEKSTAYAAEKTAEGTKSSNVSFADKLEEASKTESYLDHLRERFGSDFLIMDVGSDQKSMDKLGASTYGSNNVVIAPNILEKMANDPNKAEHYEKMISDYYKSIPACHAQLYALGFEVQSEGLVIHPDGTAHSYVSGDLRPEVRRKIEEKIKAEDEAKRKRHQDFLDASEEAAEHRRQMMEAEIKKHLMSENLSEQLYFVISSAEQGQFIQSAAVSSAMAAYGMSMPFGDIM